MKKSNLKEESPSQIAFLKRKKEGKKGKEKTTNVQTSIKEGQGNHIPAN